MVEESSSAHGGVRLLAPPFQGVARQRFNIELRPEETTVVSWKKLVKDSQRALQPFPLEPPVGAHPALEARIAPEAATGESILHKDPLSPSPNRFSAVIEKIERLYKGSESSDEEELDNVPDDDQYDTEDSFIDDAELDEYFSVDKAKTKHTGFFINRGKLERVNEPATLPVLAPVKRKKKDTKKIPNTEEYPKKLFKLGAVRIKAAARSAPLVGINATNSGQDMASLTGSEHSLDKPSEQQEVKSANNQVICSTSGTSKFDQCKEIVIKTESSMHVKASDKDWGNSYGVVQSCKESTVRGAIVAEFSDTDESNQSDKHIIIGADCQTREFTRDVGEMTTASKIKAMENAGEDGDRRDIDAVNKLLTFKTKSSSPDPKEASSGKPKCTMLERAFQELEKGVVELCPPTIDIRESDQSSQGVKKRLPREVKLRLAKVARLAQAKQGKISDEVINRLMSILGHVMRLKTLKRNLKEMVELGISAKQEKEGRLQDIKREVTEMVQMRVSSLQAQDAVQQDGPLDDFQAVPGSTEKGNLNGFYKWDYATEDRLCDLYDQYVEGMDEHKGPQIRKLYLELAELWPEGWMDNNGIKNAVYRAKERKKKLNKPSNGGEMTRRKKAVLKLNSDVWNADDHVGSVSNPNYQDLTPCDKRTRLEQAHYESVNGGNVLQSKLAKPKSSSMVDVKWKYVKKSKSKDVSSTVVWSSCEGTTTHKKKLKTQPKIDTANAYTNPMKTNSFYAKEMHKRRKQELYGMSIHNKGNIQVVGLPAHEVVKMD
eukprot:Gb_33971 [translate_table: standard]